MLILIKHDNIFPPYKKAFRMENQKKQPKKQRKQENLLRTIYMNNKNGKIQLENRH